jgi:hypothetical protein
MGNIKDKKFPDHLTCSMSLNSYVFSNIINEKIYTQEFPFVR